jgi:hypothetical protein
MSSTAIATLQTAWDCRWSRPGHRVTGIEDRLQPETLWVCVRDGDRRCISTEECEECPHWEADAALTVRVPVNIHFSDALSVAAPAAEEWPLPMTAGEFQAIGVRTVMVLIALGIIAVGFTFLTSPLAVPLTIAMWLGAGAIAGLAVFGRFPTS